MIKVSSVSGGSDEDVGPPGDRKVHKLLPRREQRAGPDHPSFSSVRAPTVPYHPISPFVFICSKSAAQLLILKRPRKEMQKAFAAPEVKDGKCRVAGVLGSEGVRKAVRRDRVQDPRATEGEEQLGLPFQVSIDVPAACASDEQPARVRVSVGLKGGGASRSSVHLAGGLPSNIRAGAQANTCKETRELGKTGNDMSPPPAKTQRNRVGMAGAPGARSEQQTQPVQNLQLNGRRSPPEGRGWHVTEVAM